MGALRDPKPATRTPSSATRLNVAVGEDKWRNAACAYNSAQRYLARLGENASERVTPIRLFRKGSPKALEAHLAWARSARRAAVEVMFAPPPTPRELANKIKLLALIHGLPDPAGYAGFNPGQAERAIEDGWAPMADLLGQLWLDAVCLDQFHDPEMFKKGGKRRRKAGKS